MTLNRKKIILLILHGMLGFALFRYSSISTYYGLMIILVGTYYILSMPDPKNQYPILFSAYIVGLEVLLRMTDAKLFWEFGKYPVIFFILLGVVRQRQLLNIFPPILIYFLFSIIY